MSEKLTLRERLHLGEKRPDGEKPRMSKKLKKAIITAVCVVAGCGAVWGGLTIARNAQRGDVNVYAVNDFAMTSYWGDSSNTSGMVTTDKLQKIYISQSQTVKKVWVKEGDTVKKGTALISYDSTLTQATVERARIEYDRQAENLEVMKNELELLKKAKNKETLQKECDDLEAKLKNLKAAYDKDESHPYDADAPVTEGKITQAEPTTITVKGADGKEQTATVYYYSWLSTSTIDEAKLGEILDNLKVTRAGSMLTTVDTYVVLVQRHGDKVGGYVESTWGMVIMDRYTADNNEVDPPIQGSKSVSFRLLNNLPDFVDTERKYDSKEIQDTERKLAIAQELLDASMTQTDLNKAILDKTQAVKEQEVNLKVAKLSLDKKLAELGDGNVYAEFDGTVKTVRDPDDAYNNGEAVVELSGGGGYYITGTLSEMELGSVKVGDTVSISSWMTGAYCEGTIVSIDDYPTQNGYSWSDGNSNVSYYPFKVFVTEDANLEPNDYVEIEYQKNSGEQSGDTLYLESMFIREDSGKSYVMVRGADGRLEKRWVQTGRDLWGSYTQIRGGLTVNDYVAFPYGRDVVEGARTTEATADQLYNYGI